MSLNLRSRGAGNAANRLSRPSLRTVYEDFKPMSEWKHEELADILLYHLPGFEKEQIKIVAETRGIIRIQGERRISENKWSRFKEEMELPKQCNMKELKAKFEKGILQITMPKQTTTTTTTQTNNKQSTLEEKQTPKPEIPKSSSVLQESQHGISSTGTDPTPLNHNTRNHVTPRIPETIAADSDDDARRLPHIGEYIGDKREIISMNKGGKDKIGKESEGSVINEKKKMNEIMQKGIAENQLNSRFGGLKNADNTSHFSRNLDEDRQLLTNMGVAIMVIFSLGAYISYSLR